MKPLVYKKSRTRAGAREPERHKLHMRKGDTVRVISGEHRGKEGKVLRVFPKEFRVEVEGVNVVKKHKRAATPNQESGIIELTAPIAASKVMLLDPKSGDPTRVRRRVDRKSTRLNSSHSQISYAVFCLKKKKAEHHRHARELPETPH